MENNNRLLVQDFIKFTNSGLTVASFNEIRETLIYRYKAVFGQDIDFSTGNADGVYINDLALLINNILQSFKSFYSNLDINEASGKYLDNLCSLSNVFRKGATRSNTSLNVTNLNDTTYQNGSAEYPEQIYFVDNGGNIWKSKENVFYQIEPNKTASIYVEAEDLGPVKADKGWINNTLEVTYLKVEQPNDANVGLEREKDNDLRIRRAQSSGGEGVTTIDSMVGALLDIGGVRDVKVYSNVSGAEIAAKDGTAIPNHNVYVVTRYDNSIDDDSLLPTIGTMIYQKMTPGIYTTNSTSTLTGTPMSYKYIPEWKASPLTIYGSDVYWKKAKSINPKITITLNVLDFFDKTEGTVIGKQLIEYLNNLALSTDLTNDDILVQTSYADPLFQGYKTFNVGTITIEGATNNKYENKDMFYNYTSAVLTEPTLSTSNVWTLTIS